MKHQQPGIVGHEGLEPDKSPARQQRIALDSDTINMMRAHYGRQVVLKMEIGQAYQDKGLVFSGPMGGPLDHSVLTRNFEKLPRQAGYPGLRLHDLRHSHAAGLIRGNANPKVVQERLGHASAAFTLNVYGHLSPGLQAEAAQSFADMMGRAPR